MRIIGDIHGHIEEYLEIIKDVDRSFQVGDLGLGFAGIVLPELSKRHRFIRGNHDNPAICQTHPNYAGEYGYDKDANLFYIGGAASIDKNPRILYELQTGRRIWWEDEELSDEQFQAASEAYVKAKPYTVISHDCPRSASLRILTKIAINWNPATDQPSRTSAALQKMFEAHQPKLWVFGHYHFDFDFEFAGTRFVCIDTQNYLDI